MVEQVCRLARVLASPHDIAHTMLVAKGCAGRLAPVVSLAAHLCGFEVFKTSLSSSVPISKAEKLTAFKEDLKLAHTMAGVQVCNCHFDLNFFIIEQL